MYEIKRPNGPADCIFSFDFKGRNKLSFKSIPALKVFGRP